MPCQDCDNAGGKGTRGGSQQGKFHLSAKRGRVKMSMEFCMWPRTTNLWLRFYLGPFSSANGNAIMEHRPVRQGSLCLCGLL